jgi:hypothetical protein
MCWWRSWLIFRRGRELVQVPPFHVWKQTLRAMRSCVYMVASYCSLFINTC